MLSGVMTQRDFKFSSDPAVFRNGRYAATANKYELNFVRTPVTQLKLVVGIVCQLRIDNRYGASINYQR